jgi:predicted metal-dependent phosphoesterase TrpH
MAKLKWYKGNLHTHTTESDGDDTPERVTGWYRRHGYDFLVLSDHNHLTLLDYGTGRRRFKRPLMVPGEEVSANIKGGSVPIHINGIGISRVVEPIDADDVVATLQANVNAITQAGGIASINHPNFRWAFDHDALVKVTGASLLEVYNGHPQTNVYGGPGKPGNDEIWDAVLTSGRPIFGVATDDSHMPSLSLKILSTPRTQYPTD